MMRVAHTRSMSEPIRIDSVHWPVTVLGFGARVGVWFQGCSIGCPGCCAKHTWEPDDDKLTTIEQALNWVRGLPLDEMDGVTISGGEPFEQPEALLCLLTGLREIAFAQPIDILCYSGFAWKRIVRRHPEIISRLDAVIAEPFIQRLPTQRLRGSANQKLHTLSALGEERYGTLPQATNELQIVATDGEIRVLGIPERGDMDQLRKRMADFGVVVGDTSWR